MRAEICSIASPMPIPSCRETLGFAVDTESIRSGMDRRQGPSSAVIGFETCGWNQMKRESRSSAVNLEVRCTKLEQSGGRVLWFCLKFETFECHCFGMCETVECYWFCLCKFWECWTISDDDQWRHSCFFLQTLSAVVSVMLLSVSV